jgi:hypothetical protein
MPGAAQPQPDQYQLRPPPLAGMAQSYAGQPGVAITQFSMYCVVLTMLRLVLHEMPVLLSI